MRLKRLYHDDKLVRGEGGAVTEVKPGAVRGVKVLSARAGVHHFTQNFIDGGVREGWLSLGGGKLTVTPAEGDPVVYRIVRTPGHYCCHCDAPLSDAGQLRGGKTLGTLHVEEKHGGAASPDPNNPAGYRRENHYTCVKEGEEVNSLTPEAAAELERQVRQALHEKTRGKLADARKAAESKTAAEAK
jgi:hypothetical protein